MHLVHTRPDLAFSVNRVAQLGRVRRSAIERPSNKSCAMLRGLRGTESAIGQTQRKAK